MGFGAPTALWALCAAIAWGQTAPAGEVVGVGGFTHIVANVEKSLEFYRDLLGLELIAPLPPFGTTSWINREPVHPGLEDPDGYFVEVMRLATVPKTNAPASSNVIGARFGIAVAGVTVISEGSAPVDTPNGGWFAIVCDPNNIFLELSQRARQANR